MGRGMLYVAGIVTWGLAVGGVGRLCAYIISEIRENDFSNIAIVYDPASRTLRAALLLSPPLEGNDGPKTTETRAAGPVQ